MSCKKVENWIESRNCTINELPAELKSHAKTCKACASFLKAIGLLSGSLQNYEISKADLAEIKTNVFNELGITPVSSANSTSGSHSRLSALLTRPASIMVAAIIATGALILPLAIRKDPQKNIKSNQPVVKSVKKVQQADQQTSAIIAGQNAKLKDASGNWSELSDTRLQMVSGNSLVLNNTDSRAKLVFSEGTILFIHGSGELRLENNSLKAVRLDAKLILYAGDRPCNLEISETKLSFAAKKQIFAIDTEKNSIKVFQGRLDIDAANETKKLKAGEWYDSTTQTIQSINDKKPDQPTLNHHNPIPVSQNDERGNPVESAADGFKPD
ncbi:MAG: hypothetical protein ACQETH_09235 [Candidatus Rifleibacteriota bacterium]